MLAFHKLISIYCFIFAICSARASYCTIAERHWIMDYIIRQGSPFDRSYELLNENGNQCVIMSPADYDDHEKYYAVLLQECKRLYNNIYSNIKYSFENYNASGTIQALFTSCREIRISKDDYDKWKLNSSNLKTMYNDLFSKDLNLLS